MRIWSSHVNLGAFTSSHWSDGRVVDTLLYLSCRYHAEHWEQLRQTWQTLTDCKRNKGASSVLYVLERLLSGMAVPLYAPLLVVLKRIVDALASKAPAEVVAAVLSEVSARDATSMSRHHAPRRSSAVFIETEQIALPDADALRQALDIEAERYVYILLCFFMFILIVFFFW